MLVPCHSQSSVTHPGGERSFGLGNLGLTRLLTLGTFEAISSSLPLCLTDRKPRPLRGKETLLKVTQSVHVKLKWMEREVWSLETSWEAAGFAVPRGQKKCVSIPSSVVLPRCLISLHTLRPTHRPCALLRIAGLTKRPDPCRPVIINHLSNKGLLLGIKP